MNKIIAIAATAFALTFTACSVETGSEPIVHFGGEEVTWDSSSSETVESSSEEVEDTADVDLSWLNEFDDRDYKGTYSIQVGQVCPDVSYSVELERGSCQEDVVENVLAIMDCETLVNTGIVDSSSSIEATLAEFDITDVPADLLKNVADGCGNAYYVSGNIYVYVYTNEDDTDEN